MIPKDLTYYKPMPANTVYMPDYIVGSYGHILPSRQKNDALDDLYFQDFDSLSERNWLTNFVIDLILMSYVFKLGLKNIHVLSVNHARQLFEKREIVEPHNKTTFTQGSTVILPWLVYNNHWIVVVLNFKTKKYYIMDSFEPYNKDIRLSKFKINVSEMLESKVIYGNDGQKCPTLSRIECPIKNVPQQNDGYNCGVYLIYYAFNIIDGSEFSLEFNPTNYREYLKIIS